MPGMVLPPELLARVRTPEDARRLAVELLQGRQGASSGQPQAAPPPVHRAHHTPPPASPVTGGPRLTLFDDDQMAKHLNYVLEPWQGGHHVRLSPQREAPSAVQPATSPHHREEVHKRLEQMRKLSEDKAQVAKEQTLLKVQIQEALNETESLKKALQTTNPPPPRQGGTWAAVEAAALGRPTSPSLPPGTLSPRRRTPTPPPLPSLLPPQGALHPPATSLPRDPQPPPLLPHQAPPTSQLPDGDNVLIPKSLLLALTKELQESRQQLQQLQQHQQLQQQQLQQLQLQHEQQQRFARRDTETAGPSSSVSPVPRQTASPQPPPSPPQSRAVPSVQESRYRDVVQHVEAIEASKPSFSRTSRRTESHLRPISPQPSVKGALPPGTPPSGPRLFPTKLIAPESDPPEPRPPPLPYHEKVQHKEGAEGISSVKTYASRVSDHESPQLSPTRPSGGWLAPGSTRSYRSMQQSPSAVEEFIKAELKKALGDSGDGLVKPISTPLIPTSLTM